MTIIHKLPIRPIRYSALLVGLLCAYWWGSGAFTFFASAQTALEATRAEQRPLRVMTWNAYFVNKTPAAFVATVATEQPDLIAIQELGTTLAEAISADLSTAYPYQLRYPSRMPDGMAILSRYPFLASTSPDFSETTGCNCLIATLDFAGQPITLISTHPWPPKMALTGGSALEYDAATQNRIFAQLFQRIGQTTHPLLVVGDLNTMPIQANYLRLSALLHDAYIESGQGPANTFPVGRDGRRGLLQALIRIDYIFYDEAWQAQRSWVGSIAGSDHRYVMAELVLQRSMEPQ